MRNKWFTAKLPLRLYQTNIKFVANYIPQYALSIRYNDKKMYTKERLTQNSLLHKLRTNQIGRTIPITASSLSLTVLSPT